MEENNRLVFFLTGYGLQEGDDFLSTRTQAGEVIGELVANFGNPKHSYLYASTTKEEDTIHVRANMSDNDVMNVAISIIKRLSESYTVESILHAIEETLR